MKICAIICEYNPLHYGHLQHIEESKRLSGADAVMCIMAGNFCQRGEPAIANKYIRSKIALEAGADIVVQMPTAYVCSSAEVFALAGVKIANSFENVTHLSFGCETTKFELLKEVAKYLAKEPKEYKERLNKYLNQGNSMAVSREKALEELMREDIVEFSEITEVLNILRKPNNILAIEYLKALYVTNSKIEPLFTVREHSDYLSEEINGKDTSATAIRARLYKTNNVRSIKKLVPKVTYNYLKEEMKVFGLPNMELFGNLCLYALKTRPKSEIKGIYDVSEGLENKFKDSAKNFKNIQELLLDVKSKRYSFTRLKRIVLRLLLNIDKESVGSIYKIDRLPFIKVLAFKSARKDLLSSISANTNLIIRNSNIVKDPDELYLKLAEIEDNANAVYNMLLTKCSKIPKYSPDLYTKTIIE